MNKQNSYAENFAGNTRIQSGHKTWVEKLRDGFLIVGSVGFFLSLFFTVFFTSGENIDGFWVLVTGWLGFVMFQFAWFANPLMLLALLQMSTRPVIALLLSIIAIVVATQTFMFNEIPAASGDEKIYIKEFGMGVYLWYGALWLYMYAVLLNLIRYGISSEEHMAGAGS